MKPEQLDEWIDKLDVVIASMCSGKPRATTNEDPDVEDLMDIRREMNEAYLEALRKDCA